MPLPTPPGADAPWSKRDLVVAFVWGIFGVIALLALMLVTLRLWLQATGSAVPQGALGLLVLVAELALLPPVWWLGKRKYRLPWSSLGFRGCDPARAAGLGCLTFLAAVASSFVWSLFLSMFGLQAQPDVLPLFGGGLLGLLAALLVGGVVAPVAEEAFFRGYLFAGLRRHVGLSKAVLVSAALFALVHVLPTSWPPIFVLGVLFAMLYHVTGSVWPAVIIHGLVNSLSFLASYLLQFVGG